ncbi:MAG: hypothetical protein WD669_08165 [Pirellulales bacterium]
MWKYLPRLEYLYIIYCVLWTTTLCVMTVRGTDPQVFNWVWRGGLAVVCLPAVATLVFCAIPDWWRRRR